MAFIISSGIILLIVGVLYTVSFIASITNRSIDKLVAYECGLEPVGDARMKFSILYYVIGILYIIFDLEIIFLFPLATIALPNIVSFINIIGFITILTIGFIYEWYSGALLLK